jgi:transcription termination/antitermination protein NusA
MIDFKLLKKGLDDLTAEKNLPVIKIQDAIERSFAAAYQKEYGEKGQIIKCHIDFDAGNMSFTQIKIVVDKTTARFEDEELSDNDTRLELPKYNEERHTLLDEAKLLKKNVALGDELVFPLDDKDDFGRIALQTAKQVIIQVVREAEREQTNEEFKDKLNTIVTGVVERVERGFTFVDIGKASAMLPFEEQIRGERLMPGTRIKAYLYGMDDKERGDLSIRLSRTHPSFLKELFKLESSEIADGIVEIVHIAREAGNRSKISVKSNDTRIDPVGSCVGQRGTRINAISSELHNERIDVILYSEDINEYIRKALSPAEPSEIKVYEEDKRAEVYVHEDELSLAIGKGGQNVRLAARLTGYKLDIINMDADDAKVDDDTLNDNSDSLDNAL